MVTFFKDLLFAFAMVLALSNCGPVIDPVSGNEHLSYDKNNIFEQSMYKDIHRKGQNIYENRNYLLEEIHEEFYRRFPPKRSQANKVVEYIESLGGKCQASATNQKKCNYTTIKYSHFAENSFFIWKFKNRKYKVEKLYLINIFSENGILQNIEVKLGKSGKKWETAAKTLALAKKDKHSYCFSQVCQKHFKYK